MKIIKIIDSRIKFLNQLEKEMGYKTKGIQERLSELNHLKELIKNEMR